MKHDKAALPAPFNQDFTGIVTQVARKRPAAVAGLVNSVLVASYLKAGSTLIVRELSNHGPADSPQDPHARPYWSGLRFLTQRAVIDEVEKIDPPFTRRKGDGPFRATWDSHEKYIHDLLTFFFHPINYEYQYGVSQEMRKGWFAHENLSDAIDWTAHHEVAAMCRMPLFRLQITMAATANRTDGIRQAIGSNYRAALDPWVKIYQETFAARGLRVRDGRTVEQIADMLAAVVEGFAIRSLGDPTADVTGETPPGNLAGAAVLGILNSYLVPIGQVVEQSLAEEFDRRTRHIRTEE